MRRAAGCRTLAMRPCRAQSLRLPLPPARMRAAAAMAQAALLASQTLRGSGSGAARDRACQCLHPALGWRAGLD